MAETAGPNGATSHTSLEPAQGSSGNGGRHAAHSAGSSFDGLRMTLSKVEGSGPRARRGAAAKSTRGADDAALREALKRCSPATYEAARLYRSTGNAEYLPAIVCGIIERFVEPDLRAKLTDPGDDLRLIEDLGIDSLTMMEVVALAEDVLQVSVDGELNQVRTLGDVRQLIACTLRGSSSHPSAELPIATCGPRGIPQFPSPWVPVRSPAEYQQLVGMSLRPKRLTTESRDRTG